MCNNRCKKIKKSDGQCKNHSIEGSDFCYIHTLGKLNKNIPFYKNSAVHFIVAIIALTFTIIQVTTSRESEIVHLLRDLDEANHKDLLLKYPGGYILFAYDRFEFVQPPINRALEEYEVYFVNSGIKNITKNSISILLPEIYPKDSTNVFRGNVMNLTFPRRVGFSCPHTGVDFYDYPTEYYPYIELIYDDN
ncbi:MAG: hypothetical protein GY839_15360, partial [candidate division Zixibacteria bacterium]|nr:hypothetical protein [candidate division Zixibacteria bacterium]